MAQNEHGLRHNIDEIWQSTIDVFLAKGMTEDEVLKYFKENNLVEKTYDMIIESFTTSISNNVIEYDKNEKALSIEYNNHLESIWGEGFMWLRQYLSICLDICEENRIYVNELKIMSDKVNMSTALYMINGKALQVYDEIICLLQNGFPDGAFAHFRMLYELWAVAEFLSTDEDGVSIAFIESLNTKSNQEASHYKWAKASKRFENVTKDITINCIVAEAHKTFKNCLETSVSNGFLNRLYTFPNYIIHPSAKGVFYRTSEINPNFVTVGSADTGISIPAINSSMYIFNINNIFMSLFPNRVASVGLGVLSYIVGQKIVPIFEKVASEQNLTIHK